VFEGNRIKDLESKIYSIYPIFFCPEKIKIVFKEII